MQNVRFPRDKFIFLSKRSKTDNKTVKKWPNYGKNIEILLKFEIYGVSVKEIAGNHEISVFTCNLAGISIINNISSYLQ